MAITWGAYQVSGTGQKTRVGIDLWYSGDPNSGSVWVDIRYYREAVYSINDSSVTLNRWGAPGSSSLARSWTSTGVQEFPDSAQGLSVSTQYGSTTTVGVGASITDVYNGLVPSAEAYLTIPARAYSAPRPPLNVSATRVSDTQHNISWSANYDGANGAQPWQYIDVERWDNVTNTWYRVADNLTWSTTSWSDMSTVADRRYKWRVKSQNSGGSSSWVETAEKHTTPAAPATPTWVKSGSNIVVSWVDNAYADDTYEVYHEWDTGKATEGGEWVTGIPGNGTTKGATISWTNTSPNSAQTHRYKVRARNTVGTSAESGWSTIAQLQTAPATPTNLGPSGAVDATQPITLTWQHNPIDGTAQTKYELQRRPTGGSWTGTGQVVSATSSHTLTANTLLNSLDYEWQVRTWGAHADPSPWSAVTPLVTSGRPTATITNTGTVTTSTFTGGWTFYDPDGGPQVEWVATLLSSTGAVLETRTGTGTAASTTFATPVLNGGSYTFKVKVADNAGLWSTEASWAFTVDYAEPPTPVMTLTWDPVAGAMHIQITNPDHIVGQEPTVRNEVWRILDGQPTLIAENIPVDGSLLDPIPQVGAVNTYRVVAVSALPSSAEAVGELEVVDTEGWVYLNGGPNMATVCRVRGGSLSYQYGREKVVNRYAGRTGGVESVGEQRVRTWSLPVKVSPNPDGGSTLAELEALQDLGGPVCYRDPVGRRWFGSMKPVSVDAERIRETATVSFEDLDPAGVQPRVVVP